MNSQSIAPNIDLCYEIYSCWGTVVFRELLAELRHDLFSPVAMVNSTIDIFDFAAPNLSQENPDFIVFLNTITEPANLMGRFLEWIKSLFEHNAEFDEDEYRKQLRAILRGLDTSLPYSDTFKNGLDPKLAHLVDTLAKKLPRLYS